MPLDQLQKKEMYVTPALVKHELLRDITTGASGVHFLGFPLPLPIWEEGTP
jgi:hypothetical protein